MSDRKATGTRGSATSGRPLRPPLFPHPSDAARRRRPSRLLLVLFLLIVLGALAAGLSACADSSGETTTSASSTAAVSTTGSVGSETTVTSESDAIDLGEVEIKVPDRTKVLPTETWGLVPVNQLIVILAEGTTRDEADKLARSLGGTVVGEIELINAYQIETASVSETDLKAAIDTALAATGVESAFPNQTVKAAAGEIWGKRISPTNDPAYEGDTGDGYRLIGVDKAWSYIRGADMDLSPVQVGVVDTGLYPGTGEFDGGVRIRYTDPAAQLSSAPQVTYGDGTTGPRTDGGHGTGINTIIGGDADDGGPVGVASPLGGMLTISNTNPNAPPYGDEYVPANPDPSDPSIREMGGGYYSFSNLAAILAQVRDGSTVINLSWGPFDHKTVDPRVTQAYRAFFEQMSRERPGVIFIASAGNEGVAMNGDTWYPGGFNLPNIITVGNVSNNSKMFKDSNTESENFEVTLSAPGEESVRGSGDNTIHETGGTSMAAPQVAAAAALIRSLNPNLDAAQIKEILRVTARKNEEGDPILAVDEAVFEVIQMTRELAGLPALTREELENRGAIDAVATPVPDSPNEYMVRAIIQAMGTGGVDVTITPSAGEIKEGDTPRRIASAGEIAWLVKMEGDEGTIIVLRGDNGAGSVITLGSFEFAGTYKGTMPVTFIAGTPEIEVPWEFSVDGEGYAKGGWKYSRSGLNWSASVTGQVSEDGRLTASGPISISATVGGKTQSESGTVSLSGDIAGGEFVGTFTQEDGSMEVTAKRQ